MDLRQNSGRVLVCDDQLEVREALRLLLKGEGYLVESFGSPEELALTARESDADVILLDMNYARDTTSGEEGLALIERLAGMPVRAALLAMTAWGEIRVAVEAMQRGASDFVEKPWSNERLLGIVAKLCVSGKKDKGEMAGARRVQERLLPRHKGAAGGLDFACRFLPAREVSGDYYDFFARGRGQTGFVLADVSGKGVAAAILMANLQALFRSHAQREGEPEELLKAVNQQFYGSTPPESYATAFYGEFEESTGEFRYVNCGHPPALLRKASGEVRELGATALVLGAFRDWHAETGRARLEAGDRLLIYSDGAVEAQSEVREEFSEERLRGIFAATGELVSEAALSEMEGAIQEHSGAVLFDDCTLLLASVR